MVGKGMVSCRMSEGTQITPTLTQTMVMATWVLFSVLNKKYCTVIVIGIIDEISVLQSCQTELSVMWSGYTFYRKLEKFTYPHMYVCILHFINIQGLLWKTLYLFYTIEGCVSLCFSIQQGPSIRHFLYTFRVMMMSWLIYWGLKVNPFGFVDPD